MPLESSVTLINDLNASWPTNDDERAEGAAHLRNIKTAVRSLLTSPEQISALPRFVDREAVTLTPASGNFTLANAPSPASSLILVRNGVVQNQGVDYTLTGANGVLNPVADALDVVLAWYRY